MLAIPLVEGISARRQVIALIASFVTLGPTAGFTEDADARYAGQHDEVPLALIEASGEILRGDPDYGHDVTRT